MNVEWRIWVKAAGLVCVFASCVLTGIELERRMKFRWMVLSEMREVLVILEKEMVFHHADIPEAFASAAMGCRTVLREVLESAAAQAEQRNGDAFERIWRTAVAEKIPEKLLTPGELLALQNTAEALCTTDTVMQRTLLQKNADRFLEMGKTEEQNYREKGGLVRRLMTAAGAFLAILLI